MGLLQSSLSQPSALQLKKVNDSGFTKYVSQAINTKTLFGCDTINMPFLILTPNENPIKTFTINIHNASDYGYPFNKLFDIAKQFMYKMQAISLILKNESFFTFGNRCISTYFINMLEGESNLNSYAEYGFIENITISENDLPEVIREEIKINVLRNNYEISEFCKTTISNFLYDLKISKEVRLCGLRYDLNSANTILNKYNILQSDHYSDSFKQLEMRDRVVVILILYDIYCLSQLCNFVDDEEKYEVYLVRANSALSTMGLALHEAKSQIMSFGTQNSMTTDFSSANSQQPPINTNQSNVGLQTSSQTSSQTYNLDTTASAPILYDNNTKAFNLILFFSIFTCLLQNNEVTYNTNTLDMQHYMNLNDLYIIKE